MKALIPIFALYLWLCGVAAHSLHSEAFEKDDCREAQITKLSPGAQNVNEQSSLRILNEFDSSAHISRLPSQAHSSRPCHHSQLERRTILPTEKLDNSGDSSHLIGRADITPAGGDRLVTVILDFTLRPVDSATVGVHCLLHIGGTASDGPLRIDVVLDDGEERAVINIADWGTEQSGLSVGTNTKGKYHVLRQTFDVGYMSETNEELIDKTTGRGIIHGIYRLQPGFQSGVNGCLNFVKRFCQNMALPIPEPWLEYLEHWQQRMVAQNVHIDNNVAMEYRRLLPKSMATSDPLEELSFSLADPNNPRLEKGTLPGPRDSDGFALRYPDEKLVDPDIDPSAYLDGNLTPTDVDTEVNNELLPPDPGCTSGTEKRAIGRPVLYRRLSKVCQPVLRGTKELTVSRINGVTSGATVGGDGVSKIIASDVRLAATISYVLVELVARTFVGIALGVTLAITGVLTDPVGVVFADTINTLISISLAIVSGTNLATISGPGVTDNGALAIVRRTYFGHPDLTGNEQCVAAGHPGCVLLLGATTISGGLNFTRKETAAYMTWANNGFHMAAEDIARNLSVGTKDKPAPADAPFYVICSEFEGDPTLCDSPKYYLQPQFIQIPYLNTTADQIFLRLQSPRNPTGDCKLINDAVATRNYPLPDGSDFLVHGSPVAFECGVIADASGIEVEADPDGIVERPLYATDAQAGNGGDGEDGTIATAINTTSNLAGIVSADNHLHSSLAPQPTVNIVNVF